MSKQVYNFSIKYRREQHGKRAAGFKEIYKEKRAPLRFGADGKFRILHLTDIHEVDPEMDDEEDRQIPISKSKETINVIRRCIEIANPDLIVFGGDNISGYWQGVHI